MPADIDDKRRRGAECSSLRHFKGAFCDLTNADAEKQRANRLGWPFASILVVMGRIELPTYGL